MDEWESVRQSRRGLSFMREGCCSHVHILKPTLCVTHLCHRWGLRKSMLLWLLCLNWERHAKYATCKRRGILSNCFMWIVLGVFTWCFITVPAGCPPRYKAALWTHGTWPLCCGSCSRQILCQSAHDSRLTLHGSCQRTHTSMSNRIFSSTTAQAWPSICS